LVKIGKKIAGSSQEEQRQLITPVDVFLTVHHSIDLFQVTNLMHTSFIL